MKASAANPYPKDFEEFLDWFQSEEDCREYLEWVRWPDGFTCPICGGAKVWHTDRGLWHYAACHRQTSVTDGLGAYNGLKAAGFDHQPHVLCKEGETARHQLDHVHLVISLLKRWLVGTHQGAVTPEHLQAYLDEFAFRFNRRLSTHRGKLFQRLIQQSVTSRPPAVNAFYSKKPQHMGVA